MHWYFLLVRQCCKCKPSNIWAAAQGSLISIFKMYFLPCSKQKTREKKKSNLMLSLPMAICKLIHTLIMNLFVPKVFTDCVACDSIKFKGIYIYIYIPSNNSNVWFRCSLIQTKNLWNVTVQDYFKGELWKEKKPQQK